MYNNTLKNPIIITTAKNNETYLTNLLFILTPQNNYKIIVGKSL